MCKNMKTDKEILKQILQYVSRHRKSILLALSAGALCAGCGVAGSELLKRVIDGLTAGTLTGVGQIFWPVSEFWQQGRGRHG